MLLKINSFVHCTALPGILAIYPWGGPNRKYRLKQSFCCHGRLPSNSSDIVENFYLPSPSNACSFSRSLRSNGTTRFSIMHTQKRLWKKRITFFFPAEGILHCVLHLFHFWHCCGLYFRRIKHIFVTSCGQSFSKLLALPVISQSFICQLRVTPLVWGQRSPYRSFIWIFLVSFPCQSLFTISFLSQNPPPPPILLLEHQFLT
jgi:hypothetical protein